MLLVECHVQPSEIMAMTGADLAFWAGCISEYLRERKRNSNG